MGNISSLLISLVALVIATASTLISYLLYRSQRDPDVVVYAVSDEKRPTVVNIIIENIGGSPALDVKFTSNRPIPAEAIGFENAKMPIQMKEGPLATGIPSLGPGASRTITWGQYGGIHKSIGDEYIDISAKYYSNPPLKIYKRNHESVSRIDIKSFEHTNAADHNWDKKSAEALVKISTALNKLSQGGIIKVSLENNDDE